MAFSSSEQYGKSYKWGFKSTDAPTIDATFSPRNGDFNFEPEVMNSATDGEGHEESSTQSKAANRKITGTISGYITDAFNPEAIANFFTWTFPGTSALRFFRITKIGEPIKKGDYVEVALDIISTAGVTSAVP